MKTFTQTSDQLYDRHEYKIVLSNGKSLVVESYEEVHEIWRQFPDYMNACIEVLDKKQKTLKKGFK
jgi:uncharacterized protein YlzI (FlbEa/FlbD family)